MKRAAKEVAYFLNTRPLCFLSTVFSLRDFLLGLSFVLGVPDLTRTILHRNLDQLGGAWIYGIIFMVIAVFTAGTAILDKNKLTRLGLQVQAWFWMFACITYIVNFNYMLSLIFGLMCSIPSGYLAFYYKYNPMWDEPKRKWRQKHGLLDKRVSLP